VIISCDVDGVVADLQTEWLRRYNAKYEDNLTLDDWDCFGVHEKAKCGVKLYEFLTDPTLYPAVCPIHGALEGVNRIRSLGHRVLFVTSCTQGMTDQKYAWLVNSGFLPETSWWGGFSKDFLTVGDKNLIDAHLLIEDRAETAIDWAESRSKPAIIYNQPWNRKVEWISRLSPWITRVNSWKDIVENVASGKY